MSEHDDNIRHETSGPSSAQETPTPTSTPTPASLSSPSPAESAKVVEKQISLLDQSHNQSENPKKRKLTSAVWNDFIKKTVNGDEITVCTHCERKFKAGSKYGTKHLHSHLGTCFKRNQVDIRQSMMKVEKKNDGKFKLGNFTFDQGVSRNDIARAIIMHEYPFFHSRASAGLLDDFDAPDEDVDDDLEIVDD
ncbi:hypothetical protein Cni_G17390 [Canna indica]|uniref:BED-type domain-containing protein n=1 Tax=Canna indica TaxID=4628 RepID=A0AAQ3KHB1_9LILI|nr:hypothetical protein Cni_G17390 [Canna indica]